MLIATGVADMKICFVVLAHHQPRTFARLIKSIAWENSDIVVHVDRRSDIKDFAVLDLPNVHFIRNRRKVQWAGWTQTSALCEALEYGLQVSKADYFMFLAGTDLPIKSPLVINQFLEKHYPLNFLNYHPLVPGIWAYNLINIYRLVDLKGRFVDIRARANTRSSLLQNFLGNGVARIEKTLNSFLPPRNTRWIRFYCGSSRWCLNRATIGHVVDYYRSKNGEALRRFLRFSIDSIEIFFQTVILNSPHRLHCLGFDESEAGEIFDGRRPPLPDEKRVYLHYIDWDPAREDPAILDESDFERLKESGKFFACKFTDEKSEPLMKRIERELLGQ